MAKLVGCRTFDNEETIVGTILQGMYPHIKLYSATLAEKKADLIHNPSEVTITSLVLTICAQAATDFQLVINFQKQTLILRRRKEQIILMVEIQINLQRVLVSFVVASI